MADEGWYADPLHVWAYRRFDGERWTYQVADENGVVSNWFDKKDELADENPPDSPLVELVSLAAPDLNKLHDQEMSQVDDGAEANLGQFGEPEVFSGWVVDPVGLSTSRYVSGGFYSPFVKGKSGTILISKENDEQFKSKCSSAHSDQTLPWGWSVSAYLDWNVPADECLRRLNCLPPEVYQNVMNGRIFSNPFWSDDVSNFDFVLIFRSAVLCLMWNEQYEKLWIEAQTKWFTSRSINRGLVALRSSALNQEVVRCFETIYGQSVGRYQDWLARAATDDPELYARVVFYEQQNQLIAEQRQQNALLRNQNYQLQLIRQTQDQQLIQQKRIADNGRQ